MKENIKTNDSIHPGERKKEIWDDESYDINNEAELRKHYPVPREIVVAAKSDRLNENIKTLISACRYFCLASIGDEWIDISPRGGEAGFIHIIDDRTIAFLDYPGNNKLETITNVLRGPGQVGVLILQPQLGYSIRLHGKAKITQHPELLKELEEKGKKAKLAIMVRISKVYPHCSKSTGWSQVWNKDSHVDKDTLPTMSQIVNELAGIE